MKIRYIALLMPVVLLLATCSPLSAQDEAEKEKTLPMGWNNTMVAGLNLSQVYLDNWAQGGENSLAWTVLLNGKFLYKHEKLNWKQTLSVRYGQTRLGDAEYEKTDDELFYDNILSFVVGWKVEPYVALQARTQMGAGYKMIDTDVGGETVAVRTQTSAFFDPGYLQQSAGFSYEPSDVFYTRLGVAVKETFSGIYGYADDPETEKFETTRTQTGIESATGTKLSIMENVLFTSQLNLFSAFDQLDVWDVRWDNLLSMKVNSYIQASVGVLLLHEIKQTRRTQLKEMLAIGISYTLL